jgi:tetratricopeptide (TPR) repeat protein
VLLTLRIRSGLDAVEIRSANIKYVMGADLVRLFKLILMAAAALTVGQAYVCGLLSLAYLSLMYCDYKWIRPRLAQYTQAATSDITRLLALGETSNAIGTITEVAWVRFFGYQPLVLELMGLYALAKRELNDAIAYFQRAIIDVPADQGIDAHFGILKGQLLAGDIDGAMTKAESLRALFNDDTFVELRLELLFDEHR